MEEDKLSRVSSHAQCISVIISKMQMTSIFRSVFRKCSTSITMSSSKPLNENEKPKGRNPGLRGVQTTMLFRAVNPELFIKPVRGLVGEKLNVLRETCLL